MWYVLNVLKTSNNSNTECHRQSKFRSLSRSTQTYLSVARLGKSVKPIILFFILIDYYAAMAESQYVSV